MLATQHRNAFLEAALAAAEAERHNLRQEVERLNLTLTYLV
jgi:hypothetical protein